MKRTSIFTLLGLTAVISVGWFYFNQAPTDEQVARQLAKISVPGTPAVGDATSGTISSESVSTGEAAEFVDTLARELATEFGALIDDVSVQARLYQIRQAVLERFPEQGAHYFRQAIYKAFPDHAEAIMALVTKLDQYHEWLLAQNRTLMELPPLQSMGLLWQKRRELFGEQAEIIWADERQDLAQKRQEFKQTLQKLNDAKTVSLDEKLHQLKTSLAETFDGQLQELVDNRGMITQVFLSLDSVQSELSTLPPEQRQAQIDHVRRQMGFTEEQVERLREQDQERNSRWDTGKAYMAERERLLAQADGPALQVALNELREKHFGREAHTIRLEEESGFFRFERPRVYGRN